MDSSACSNYTIYPVHGFDSRQFLENYMSDKPEMVLGEDTLLFPIENLAKAFKKGHITGDVVIDLTCASVVHHLYAACEYFQRIIVLKVSDRCIMELKRWLDTRTGAFNWGHAAKLHADLKGNGGQFQFDEEKVRSAIPYVVNCDLENENMTDPIILPPADCLITVVFLEVVSKDQDDYIRYLRKMARLLKLGGHLLLIGCLGMTYFMVGKDKIRVFRYDEDFARKALVREGFVIDTCVVKKRTVVSDLLDHKAMIFIAAHKEK